LFREYRSSFPKQAIDFRASFIDQLTLLGKNILTQSRKVAKCFWLSGHSRDVAKQHRSGVSKLAFDHAAKQRHSPAAPGSKRQAFALLITANTKEPCFFLAFLRDFATLREIL